VLAVATSLGTEIALWGTHMREKPSSKSSAEGKGLRDYLADHRTILANERTFLAYLRTALTLFVAGVSFIRFFDSLPVEVVGWIFLPFGLITLLLGAFRYRKTREELSHAVGGEDDTRPDA
jgi:putative membrane protein